MAPETLASALDDASTLGVKAIRLDLSWADVQPSGPDAYNWVEIDRVTHAAVGRHLALLPVIAYTPQWARPAGCQTEKCAPADANTFARFAAEAARRYAPLGIHTWEIWNEQNTSMFWQPKPDPIAYAGLLTATARAVRQVDSKALIVLGGLAAKPDSAVDVNQLTFLRAICAAGAGDAIDAVGYHPYTFPYSPATRAPWSAGTAWDQIDRIEPSVRSVIDDCGRPDLQIWLTEYGAPTGGLGAASDGGVAADVSGTDHVTEGLQADLISAALRTTAASPTISAIFIYTDRDLPGEPTSEGFFGLRRADGSPKPAFWALRDAIASQVRSGGLGS